MSTPIGLLHYHRRAGPLVHRDHPAAAGAFHVEGDRLGQGLGLGSTDALTGDVATWSGAIVTTYVGGRSLEKIAKTIWGKPIWGRT
jgi:hypothetical protein